MITDTLQHIGQYQGMDLSLDRGLEYLKRVADDGLAQRLADGRYEIQGQELYASVSTYTTQKPSVKPFEAHRKYIDLQYVFSGRETLYWSLLDRLRLEREYSEAEDSAHYSGPEGVPIPLEAGCFAVLFPQDAHKPGCIWDKPGQVHKLVVKVRVG